MSWSTSDFIAFEQRCSAPNYHPLPVVVSEAEGAWVTDVEGRRYLDFLSAYSALNFGHRHPKLIEAAKRQLDLVTLTSRAVHAEVFGRFCQELVDFCGMDMALMMNSGAEGVETAIKIARKWGYDVKGVATDQATIVVAEQNFHGRTTTIIGFSSDEGSRQGFGPFTPGFTSVPYGDAQALEAVFATDPNVVGYLVEPVQGEAGVIVPPDGYLKQVRSLCDKHKVLMIADEIQTGFGRTGYTFGCDREAVKPDLYILGKALGGGIIPLSAVVGSRSVLGVMGPGTHGSTFGGNPLACAIGLAVLELASTGEYQERSRALGEHLHARLTAEAPETVAQVRGVGLWAGIVLKEEAGPARDYSERLLRRGVIAKETHVTTLRLAPPLCISEADLDTAIDAVIAVLSEPVD